MTGKQYLQRGVVRRPGWDQHWHATVLCLVLAAITLAVFGQTAQHEFVNCDDPDYVYGNPVVTHGLTLKGIVWAFTVFHADNWHPLTWVSHMLDCQLYGLHPGGHHITNVLLHTATVILLFLVLRQMTGALWRSAFVAAVFAIHPLRVESVVWVAERKDVLSGLFFMLTIAAYVRYARRPWSIARYGLVMLLFAMGLMCKPMLVTLPVALLLLDYWPLQRAGRTTPSVLMLEKLPLLALSAASSVITLLAQTRAIESTETISLPLRFGNALTTCMIYLEQMVWPAGLALFYPYPQKGLPTWEVALAGTLLAGLSMVVWRERRTRPWLLTGWAWYLVMLLPVAGIIQVGVQAHADRYTYLPQIGIYVAATWLLAEWGVKWLQREPLRAASGSLMTGIIAVLMVCAWNQTAYWKDDETLWSRSLACTTDNAAAHLNFGSALLAKDRADDAIIQYQQALLINPDYADAHFNLGNALRKNGRLEDAIAQYQQTLLINPNLAEARLNLGVALSQKGKLDDTITQYQKALQINPNYAEAHVNLGNALAQKGKLDDAVTQYRLALQIRPDDEVAHASLGIVLAQAGRAGEAIRHLLKALQIQPANPESQNNLAWLLATCPEAPLRDGNKAVELARQANALTGGENPFVLHTLAAALAEAGRFSEALQTAQRALGLAGAQSDARLAGQLQMEMKLYQTGSAFHSPEPAH
ncbi:MAG: tetratricopeptide repeat protein [Verrucomicrobiota bacterium]|jgi:tetratricopeptide (TPR) repeat protein